MKNHKKWFLRIVLLLVIMTAVHFIDKPLKAEAAEVTARTFLKVKIDPVYDTSTYITGSAAARSTVSIQIAGRVYKVRADNAGRYEWYIGGHLPVNTWIKVSCNSCFYSSSSLYVQKDPRAVPAPYLEPVTENDTTISGTAREADRVEIYIDNAVYWGYPDRVTGKFTVALNRTLPAGTKITAQSRRGNYQSLKTTITVSEAPVKLIAPTLENITDKDVSVKGIAKDAEIVYLKMGTTSYYAYPNATTGAFTIELNKAYPAGTKVEAYSKKGSATSSVTTAVVLEGAKTITAPTVNTVSSEDTMITGTADPNVKLIAKVGTDEYEGYSDNSGKFSLRLDKAYPAGTYVLIYASKDGQKSTEVITTVVQGAFLLGINMVKDQDGLITGKTIANAEIKVRINDRVYQGNADSEGYFQIMIAKTYKAGQNVEITAVDPVSKHVERKFIQIYPAKPTINTVRAGADNISGTASPRAYVIVRVGGKDYGTFASASGYYFVSINPNDAVRGAKVEAFQISQNIESAIAEVEILN